MRKSFKILFGIIAVLFVIALLLRVDDELLPEVQILVNKAQAPNESDAFFYLLGFSAALGKEPIAAGKEIFNIYLQTDNEFLGNKANSELPEYSFGSSLPQPEGPLTCVLKDKDCVELLFSDTSNLGEFLQKNTALLERYEAFIKLDDYATLNRPSHYEPTPQYSYLTKASRLIMLAAIKEAKASNHELAVSRIMQNITNLRRHLAHQDTFAGKLIYLGMISDNLDFAFLLSNYLNNTTSIEVQGLTKQEKNFDVLMARELSALNHLFTMLGTQKLPAWSLKYIYKSNMMMNAQYSFYEAAVEKASLSHSEFAKEGGSKAWPEIHTSNLRSPLNIIYADGLGDRPVSLDLYLAAIFDLDVKIQLFNSAMNVSDVMSLAGSLQNPYYEKDHTAYLAEDKRRICFEGPLDSPNAQGETNFRCLRIKM